ncbi:MAG: hypothetical protein GEU81_18025 [Nitriliruptorales bacterium]|nr:hypothetical protein [Nitriliruptorales bacterium]
MTALLDGVIDVDRALAPGETALLSWQLERLENRSGVAILREQPVRDDVADGYAARVRRRYITQLRVIQTDQGLPPDLSMSTVEGLGKVVRAFSPDGANALRAVDVESGEAASLTQEAGEAIRRMVIPRFSSIGAVTGALDTIGRRGGTYATVYEEIHGRAVRCEFESQLLPAVKEAFGKRVVARGIVHYSEDSGVSRMRMRELEVLPTAEELPTVAQMYGSDPGFTGGLSTAEYISRLRDEPETEGTTDGD